MYHTDCKEDGQLGSGTVRRMHYEEFKDPQEYLKDCWKGNFLYFICSMEHGYAHGRRCRTGGGGCGYTRINRYDTFFLTYIRPENVVSKEIVKLKTIFLKI